MNRNMDKWSNEGREAISYNRDLSIEELRQLMDTAGIYCHQNEVYEAVCKAFYAGFAVGFKAGKVDQKEGR